MAKRGKVLRDPHMGPGLLMVEGKQYPFLMDGLWRSEVPAKPGLVVSVDFDTEGNLNGITAVPQTQLDQEQAERVRSEASSRNIVLENWTPSTRIVARVTLAGLLALSWLFLTAISIHQPFFGRLDLTFWQVLGYLNTGNSLQASEISSPDSGIYGFLAILVLAGPFLHYFWKDRRIWLGGILPLGFMALVAYRLSASIHAAFATQLTGPYESLQNSSRHEVFSTVSVGLGTYLSVSIAIYFAVLSTQQFLGRRRFREREPVCSQEMAA